MLNRKQASIFVWHSTEKCVLGYTLLWHCKQKSVRNVPISREKTSLFDYICAQNAQCWARITKSNMEIQRYNRLKIVLAEKERTGTWLSEQMGHSISTVSRWMTNKVQPSVEQLYEIARHLDVDVKELLVSSK